MSLDGVFHREVFGGLIEGSTSPVARHLFAKWNDIKRVRAPTYGDFLPDSSPRVTDKYAVRYRRSFASHESMAVFSSSGWAAT